jgi:hypothetical protein
VVAVAAVNQIKLEPMVVLAVEAGFSQVPLVVKVLVVLATPHQLHQAKETMVDTGNTMEPRIAVVVVVVLVQSEQTIMHLQTAVLEVHHPSLVLRLLVRVAEAEADVQLLLALVVLVVVVVVLLALEVLLAQQTQVAAVAVPALEVLVVQVVRV